MKFLKKAVCLLFSGLVLFGGEANALFGNSHYNISREMLENSGFELSDSEKTAFLSGAVYADIGRFKFDKISGVESDSDEFVDVMSKHIQTNEEKWFVEGFKVHNFQDKKTREFLKSVFGAKASGYKDYISKCISIDKYFTSKNKSFIFDDLIDNFKPENVLSAFSMKKISEITNIPQEKLTSYAGNASKLISNHYENISKDRLCLYEDILLKTYKDLGLDISSEELKTQAANVIGSVVKCYSLVKGEEITENLSSKIDFESKKLALSSISAIK